MFALIVSPSIALRSGGLAESVLSYVDSLTAHGVATGVLAPACNARDRERFQLQAPTTQLELVRCPGCVSHGIAPLIAHRLTHLKAHDTVVHVFGLLNPVSTLSATVALRRRRPLVVCPLGMLSPYTYSHRRTAAKALYFRLFEYPILRRAQAIHFQSEPERVEAAWHGLLTADREYVVPPPARLLKAGAAGGQACSTSKDPVALFLARLDPKKNLELLLDAWPTVRAALPTARLVIAGDGEPRYVRSLHARAAASDGHPDSITFHGIVDGEEKARLLRSARVFVLPSSHENFGIAVLEAISFGVPVVISREVQLAQIVQEHTLGIVTDRSAAALAQAVMTVLTNSSLGLHVRELGPSIAGALFSPQPIGARLLHMYEDAAKRVTFQGSSEGADRRGLSGAALRD